MNKTDEQVGENIIAEFKKQNLLPDAALVETEAKADRRHIVFIGLEAGF